MTYNAEERAYLWLCACTDTEYRERASLLRAAGAPSALFEQAERYLPAKTAKTREEREREVDRFLAMLERKGYFAVTLLSDDYPEMLRHISTPPFVLYGAGRRELLQKKMFCIVGSRITPPWAEKMARSLSEAVSRHFAVVTGLAEGGDSAAIAGAISSGNLICVLPCGLDNCYPAAHEQLKERVRRAGLLLSEFLPSETTKKYSFHARNRILAGMCEGTLVVSAAKRSGALITANVAIEYCRNVYALPYSVGVAAGEGCNNLIKMGAYLVTEAEDILACYGKKPVAKAEVSFTEEERRILSVLRQNGELHLVKIAEEVGIRPFEVSAILSALEIKGVIVKSGGNKYAAV